MNDFTTSDPAAVQRALDELNNLTEPETKVETVAPSKSEVTLPGGFITREGSLVKYGEVRELNGLDEEAIAKAGSIGRALMLMLQRGVVSLGLEKATREDLDNLLSGDRDALLVGIRRLTFGDILGFSFKCPSCQEELEVALDLNKDIPYSTLANPMEDRHFIYTSPKVGDISVSLPTGTTQKKLLENTDKTVAELNTILLTGCINSVGGSPSLGSATVLRLGMADREAIVAEIIKRSPGPRLGEVKTTCEACGSEIPLALSLADLFRL